jgi:hypothetical protein
VADGLTVSPCCAGAVLVDLHDGSVDSAYSKPGSPDKALSNTPLSAQHRKRFHTENQFPKQCGRSRHGAPVRTIHNNPYHKHAVVISRTAGVALLAGKKRRDALPLLLAEDRANRLTSIFQPESTTQTPVNRKRFC